jgi:hypothetical protein
MPVPGQPTVARALGSPTNCVEAFEAIAQTLPLGSVRYERETNANGERLIWLATNVVDRQRSLRGPELQRRDPGAISSPSLCFCFSYRTLPTYYVLWLMDRCNFRRSDRTVPVHQVEFPFVYVSIQWPRVHQKSTKDI